MRSASPAPELRDDLARVAGQHRAQPPAPKGGRSSTAATPAAAAKAVPSNAVAAKGSGTGHEARRGGDAKRPPEGAVHLFAFYTSSAAPSSRNRAGHPFRRHPLPLGRSGTVDGGQRLDQVAQPILVEMRRGLPGGPCCTGRHPAAKPTASRKAAPHLDQDWLRELVEGLASIHRPTASAGERVAAEWVAGRLRELGAADARVEREEVHGTFWWPLGLAAVAGVATGLATLRGRRIMGGTLAGVAGAAAADDLPPGGRRLRSFLPRRSATAVVAELGPPDADRTVVLVAHHDAAHAGLLYHPAIPETCSGASRG